MKDCLILGGRGKVGSALAAVLSDRYTVAVCDLGDEIVPAEVLHVCIPWSDTFCDTVRKAQSVVGMTVIHSTVTVGTCDSMNANHSPVRGQHNDLAGSLRKFTKYVAGPQAVTVCDHLLKAGIPAFCAGKDPKLTELGKILCLSRFLAELRYYQWADAMFQKHGLEREFLLHWTETYNLGYAGTRFQRSTLEFPNAITGCVTLVPQMLPDEEFVKF